MPKASSKGVTPLVLSLYMRKFHVLDFSVRKIHEMLISKIEVVKEWLLITFFKNYILWPPKRGILDITFLLTEIGRAKNSLSLWAYLDLNF